MSFSEMSKNEAVQLIEAKIKGEQNCYSSIVNEAVRMIKEERNKVELYENALLKIVETPEDSYKTFEEAYLETVNVALEVLNIEE